MINKDDTLSVIKQCAITAITRSSVYYNPVKKMTENRINIMHAIDRIYTDHPFYGHRRICDDLNEQGYSIGRDRTLHYMQEMGIEAIYPKRKKNTSIANKEHKVYPYLLRDLKIIRENSVTSSVLSIGVAALSCLTVSLTHWTHLSVLRL